MRNVFAAEITKLAQEDARVVLMSGDIGNKLFDKFKQIDERRFFNCGVAEANMMGVAAGLALNGLRPFVYTITPFTTTRCQIHQRAGDCCCRADGNRCRAHHGMVQFAHRQGAHQQIGHAFGGLRRRGGGHQGDGEHGGEA